MSVSCGIPDFRSTGVGLYDTLRPELLTVTEPERELIGSDTTLALDRGLFLQNPLPMLETKRGFILGTSEKRWRAMPAHRFVEMLRTKLGKLVRFVEMLHTKLGKLVHPEHRRAGMPDASPEGEGGQRGEWHSEGWGKCRIPRTSYYVEFSLRNCNVARVMDR
jgi:hypothetical protein